jgi:heme-degrading monooxygenase HmoA
MNMPGPLEETTIVDTMAVPDGRQQEALAAMRVLFTHLQGLAGFLDAHLFESVDGTVLLSYARMRSRSDRQAAEMHPEVKAALRALRAIGHVNVHTYRPVLAVTAESEPEPPASGTGGS